MSTQVQINGGPATDTGRQHSLSGMAAPRGVRRVKVYVTASHTVRVTADTRTREVPFGIGHLRELGSKKTACGLPAFNWPILWDERWNAVDQCPDCAHELAVSRMIADA